MGQTSAGVILPGTIVGTDLAGGAGILRTQMAPTTLDIFALPLEALRTWDSRAVNLPATPASDDLGLITGTYATDPPTVQTGDVKATTTTRRAGMIAQLPNLYVAAGQVSIYAIVKMLTTVADTSATLAVEASKLADDGTVSSNLVTGGAQNINNLSLQTLNFPITATTLTSGSRLDLRFSIAVVDSATVTAVKGYILALYLKCNVQP